MLVVLETVHAEEKAAQGSYAVDLMEHSQTIRTVFTVYIYLLNKK